jgi:SAM-dependent methyltransferase
VRTLVKIISGGQTGVDQAALRAARHCGLEIGGWCPPGRECEAGVIPLEFPLMETPRDRSLDAPKVPRSQRTEWNVRDSDGTLVIVAGIRRDGVDWTIECASRYQRPLLVCDLDDPKAKEKILEWLKACRIRTLNVAGSKESVAPGIEERAHALLAGVFKEVQAAEEPGERSVMSRSQPNRYSPRWFEFFQAGISQERTAKEVGFICQLVPLPEFRKVLDLCCGTGRHARALAERGYTVTGVERDLLTIRKACELGGGPEYVQADVLNYRPNNFAFDVVIIMSQSFGYFDCETNRELLGRLAGGIRKGGRIILDLWNRDFFVANQNERTLETPLGGVRETKRIENGRLHVDLTYPDGAEEEFEWQLFTVAEMQALAESVGLRLIVACTNFKQSTAAEADNPRIQFVLERS